MLNITRLMTFLPSDRRASGGGASRRSLALLGVATIVGLIHHTDHVLRGDHSGWPFASQVTPFTFSLVVYPLLWLAYRYQARPKTSALLVTAVLALAQFSHIVFELPHDQYRTWATGINLLHVHSPALGIFAAGLSVLLSLTLFATAVSFAADTKRQPRFRQKEGSS